MKLTSAHKHRHFKHPLWTALVCLAIGLIGFRLYLPTLVKNYLNGVLDRIPHYQGHIEDVDLHLWRGAFTIHALKLDKIEGNFPVPFFEVRRLAFTIHWRSLLHGQLVGELGLRKPVLNFVAADQGPDQLSIDKSWQDRVQELFPLRINEVTVTQGEIHFRNFQAKPPVNVYLDQLEGSLINLTNSEKLSKTLKASATVKARAMGTGRVGLHLKVDPFAKRPTFAGTLSLEELPLASLNDFLSHYVAVEAKAGQVSFYLEGEAIDGAFEGYAKPLISEADVIHIKEKASIGEFFKGLAVKLISYTFKNHPKNRLAAKIPISGTVDSPDPNTWKAVWSFLKNWAIKAIKPGFDKK